MLQELMTVKDATHYLKLNRMTIYKMAREGKLPAVKIAGEWRFNKATIGQWMEESMRPAAAEAMGQAKESRKTILVVDDNKEICDFFVYVLEREGYKVEVATNGQKALNFVKENTPCLILLDLKMPGMDGLDVLDELKKMSCSVPVIMLSDYAEIDLNIKAARRGAHNCIVKPSDIEKMKRAIEEAMEKA